MGMVAEKVELTNQQVTTWFCAVLKAEHVMQVTRRVDRHSFWVYNPCTFPCTSSQ